MTPPLLTAEIELVLDAKATLGEGPFWDQDRQVLWWVDIMKGELHCYTPADGTDQIYELGQMVGSIVTRQSGGLVLATEHGFAAFDPPSRDLQPICDPEADLPDQRFNDGKCDPSGRFWAGTMHKVDRNPTGALYCLDLDGQCHRRLDGVTVSNGIVWTDDAATMYYIDTPTRRVDAFDFDRSRGEISNRRTVVTIPTDMGKPDGMAIDANENLWVALWGGSAVIHCDPRRGEIMGQIAVPSTNVTACAFGGPQLEDLYITTARNRVSDDELIERPHSGGLFRVRVGVQGRPTPSYLG